jgi:hypothetical protein
MSATSAIAACSLLERREEALAYRAAAAASSLVRRSAAEITRSDRTRADFGRSPVWHAAECAFLQRSIERCSTTARSLQSAADRKTQTAMLHRENQKHWGRLRRGLERRRDRRASAGCPWHR